MPTPNSPYNPAAVSQHDALRCNLLARRRETRPMKKRVLARPVLPAGDAYLYARNTASVVAAGHQISTDAGAQLATLVLPPPIRVRWRQLTPDRPMLRYPAWPCSGCCAVLTRYVYPIRCQLSDDARVPSAICNARDVHIDALAQLRLRAAGSLDSSTRRGTGRARLAAGAPLPRRLTDLIQMASFRAASMPLNTWKTCRTRDGSRNADAATKSRDDWLLCPATRVAQRGPRT